MKFETPKDDLCSIIGIEEIEDKDYAVYFHKNSDQSKGYYCRIGNVKPHCYRLSDLDKLIPELGLVPRERLGEILFNQNPESFDDDLSASIWANLVMIDPIENWPFIIFSSLIEWHFWPFGEEYFEQGLVIDKLLCDSAALRDSNNTNPSSV
ncbi:hypothetical protein V8V91_08660 [Algoriphagus halophilus]|uniref:hypothetical protein n=1 Tax=Algoriphagus halophilus TaxID=226505 RepID=UPI00358DE6D9